MTQGTENKSTIVEEAIIGELSGDHIEKSNIAKKSDIIWMIEVDGRFYIHGDSTLEVSVNSSLVNKFCKTNYTCFRGEKDESIVNTIGKRNTIQGI